MIPDKPDIFAALIDTHKGIIYRIANLYCPDKEERKDLVQEILFQVWRSFDRYNDQYKQSTWIYRIALNVAISFYRKEKSRRKISGPYPEAIFNMAEEPQQAPATAEILLLQQFISELKELNKAVMLLYLEEKTHKEIAEIIGITETNVATKIGRIKKQLKQKFLQKTI
jgi:RNA polymerase sigma factor (sigma-70 family)